MIYFVFALLIYLMIGVGFVKTGVRAGFLDGMDDRVFGTILWPFFALCVLFFCDWDD